MLAGAALAAPLVLVVTRPLPAWRVGWVAAVVTGTAVQSYERTPFSWHPAFFVAMILILCVVALRSTLAVTAWAWASMAGLIVVSFYPADRVPLIAIVTAPVAIACLVRHRRARSTRRVLPES
jgi:hypothetical protein